MSKLRYVHYLKEIKKIFSEDKKTDALADSLINIINDYPEDLLDNNFEQEEYPIPKELDKNSNSFVVFSDGACKGNPGPGAWGIIGQEVKTGKVIFESSGLEVSTTNNKMELEGAITAMSELLAYMREHNINSKGKDVYSYLYSDSKYFVDGISKWVPGWKARGWKKADNKIPENVELWQKADKLQDMFKNIEFRWVKGHSGHPQNERCDRLANEALKDSGF